MEEYIFRKFCMVSIIYEIISKTLNLQICPLFIEFLFIASSGAVFNAQHDASNQHLHLHSSRQHGNTRP